MPLDALLSAIRDLRGGSAGRRPPTCSGRTRHCSIRWSGTRADHSQLPALADSMLGPAVLYAALARLIRRLIERGPLIVVVDGAHLAGRALADLLRFVIREDLRTVIVVAVRTGEGVQLPSTARIGLEPLSRAAVAELVGASRADDLYARSRGHPLFLTELAQQSGRVRALPVSLVESVLQRAATTWARLGAMVRATAVIGPGARRGPAGRGARPRRRWRCSTTPSAPWPPGRC